MEGSARDGSCKREWALERLGGCVLSAPASRVETPAGRIHIISVSMAAGTGEGKGADGAGGCGAGPARWRQTSGS